MKYKGGSAIGYTTDTYIVNANRVHNYKYNYDKLEYIRASDKVCVTCLIHGDFYIRASVHLIGQGCRKCSDINTSKRQLLDTESFIQKAKEVHGDKYDYWKVEYKGCFEKIEIICPEHGSFWQTPTGHINSHGCFECVKNNSRKRYAFSTEQFIKKAQQIHGDKYDYSKVEYVNAKTKVCIICSDHGEFWQYPSVHLYNKGGCPSCRVYIGEETIAHWLDENNILYKRRKSFNDCRHINALTFDFYLIDKNICIEFNGMQHYKPIAYFGGEDSFIAQQKRDNIKRNYCINNSIKLLEIRYNELDKIKDILNKEIFFNTEA